ncbi:cardiolipin synthase [Paenibacillus sp. MER TA 81-3]|uniref:cardiolipin synthase n=1 Tax=Paenibacillus sp. MER TA 81-3 TaxID=2939573 RepID=UPI00203ED068|nr:cardiolipin synthase [Paenibacillus sp. MER TA 81-3]MCM3338644.1 cardiolipin synthase [Paenibacillus sp. MER TA 81-3]
MRRALQVGLFIIMLLTFGLYINDTFGNTIATALSIMTTLAVITLAIIIFMENRHPSSTVAWILVLALVPVVGFIFYMLFGQNYRKRRRYARKAQQDRQAYAFIDNESLLRREQILGSFTDDQRQLLRLTSRLSKSPISFSSDTRILNNGEETFAALLAELGRAVHHIHMEYYIYRDDDIGRKIKYILMEKARQGVEVRFMVDAVGSMQLPKSFLNDLRRAGVEVAAFGAVKFPLFSNRVNYRNHRKIVVIDGDVGFIGGLNVGDEYLSRSKTYGFWRDTHMIVRGEAVQTLQIIFLQDWAHTTAANLYGPEYLLPRSVEATAGAVQIIASGPDQDFKTMKNVFFSMLTSAKKSIWIATPYFIPDEDIFTALRVAALAGIDVKLLFPAKPDKWLPFFASHSYFPGLMETGVQIYEYEKGFLHSKLIIVDGEIATIGTANMDMRSFHLNFEVNAILMRTDSVAALVEDFERDLQYTTPIEEEEFAHKKMITRFLESAARLFSPLL